jgi:predicted secreted protein
VIYRGDLNAINVSEIFSASTTTAATQIKLNDAPAVNGAVNSATVTPDGSRTIFAGDVTTNEVFELYSASTSAPGTQTRLTDLPADADVGDFAVTPDGRFVVLVVSDPLGARSTMSTRSEPTLGLSPSVSLTSPVAHFAEIYQFAITSDSRRVVLHADLDEDDVFYLYSVDLPAAPATLKINGKKTIKTSKKRLTIRGTAKSAAGIQKVEFKVPGSGYKKAKGTASWRATIRPTKKRTSVKVLAIANGGKASPVSKVTIKRK